MSARILLADDHTLVREGLRSFLERQQFKVVCDVPNGQEAIRMAKETQPDSAILDISMPILNGIDTARELGQTSQKTKVIILTKHADDQYISEALGAGVKGYVLKSQVAADLVDAIHEVCRGSVYISPAISHSQVQSTDHASQATGAAALLSGRERQVLQLVSEGHSTKDIAAQLGISVKTVESHRTNLMKKLDIHERAGLVRYAVRSGLIQV